MAITSASASEERPPSGMVTMSSALSSSSEVLMRSSSASSTAYSGWFAAFFREIFLETGFFGGFLAAGLDFFAGAFFAVLAVRAGSPEAVWGAIYH